MESCAACPAGAPSNAVLGHIVLFDASARTLELVGLIEERVPPTDRPLHLVSVDGVGVAYDDGAPFGQQVGGYPRLAKLLREEDRVAIPQHRVDLVQVLAVVDELLDAVEVPGRHCAPPRVL